ncbi:MAG: hypothetical protein UU52_C0040G0003 [Candidatus Levybacteria bacterium GW2011_GWB1_41_21]|nr:MAG: hypothetical protein UU52_C0040G0003 [Candidatus Levybacteria bacterium GW2011_GWB1_41_21]
MSIQYDVADLSLAPQGELKIEWAGQQMPVLATIKMPFMEKIIKLIISI